MRFLVVLGLCCFYLSLQLQLQVGVLGESISSIITKPLFEEMLKNRNNASCPAKGFYTYEAFITAADYFGDFGTHGSLDTRKREIAAFLAHTSHETTVKDVPDRYAWGYCLKEEINPPGNYCVPMTKWPCAPEKKYYGRGPFQIRYNYNYGPAGVEIGETLLTNPEKVANDSVISFKTALWFWTTPHAPNPSCHDIMNGVWRPTPADNAAGRSPGFGATINLINGKVECGYQGFNPRMINRIGFYKRYCDLLNVTYGNDVNCAHQIPFDNPQTNYEMLAEF